MKKILLFMIILQIIIYGESNKNKEIIADFFKEKITNKISIKHNTPFTYMLTTEKEENLEENGRNILEERIGKNSISEFLNNQRGNIFAEYEKMVLEINAKNVKNENDLYFMLNLLHTYKFSVMTKDNYIFTGLKNLFSLVDNVKGNILLETKLQTEIKELMSLIEPQKTKGFYDYYVKGSRKGLTFNSGMIQIKLINFDEKLYADPIIKIFGPAGLVKELAPTNYQKLHNTGEKGENYIFTKEIIIYDLRTDCSYDLYVNCQSAIFRNGPVKSTDVNKAKKNGNTLKNYSNHKIIKLTDQNYTQSIDIDFKEEPEIILPSNKLIF